MFSFLPGVMLIKDLHRKFQDSSVKDFILNLLNKCEVAVTYDNEHILVPSRLPVEGLDMTMIPLIREKDISQKVFEVSTFNYGWYFVCWGKKWILTKSSCTESV